jgi:predicted metal-dependent peptidase
MSNIGQQTSASRGGSFSPLSDPIHAKVQKAFNRLTKAQWRDNEGKTRLGVGFASMISKLPFVEDNNQSTMCTDGSCIKFNRKFVDGCSLDEVIFVLVHEADHVAYCHHLRLGKRNHQLANIAMDFAINIHLVDCGFVAPDGVLLDEKFRGWTWEKIYSFLYKEWEEELEDQPEEEEGGLVNEGGQPVPSEDGEEGDEGEGESEGEDEGEGEGEGSGEGESDEEGEGQGNGDQESDEEGEGESESEGEGEGEGEGEESDTGGGEGEGEGESEGEGQGNGQGQGQGNGDGDPVQGEVGWEDIDPTNLPDSHGGVEEATDENGQKASDWDDAKIQTASSKVGATITQARSIEKLAGRGIGSGEDFQSSTGDLMEGNEIPVAWIEQVAQFLEVSKSQDYDFARPNRRFVGNDEYFPSMDNPEGGHLALMIDTSGSVSLGEMESFVSTINTLVERFSFDKVTIIYCSHLITAVRTFEDGEEVEVERQPSGGTLFYPPFELIERGGSDKFGDIDKPTVAIYFTDGEADVVHREPEKSYIGCDEDDNLLEPDYPVLWATTNVDPMNPEGWAEEYFTPVPWGQTVWVDLHE